MHRPTTLGIALVLVATAGTTLAAQEPRVVVAGESCPPDAPVVGSLGYSGLSCNCTHYFDPEDTGSSYWRFRSEPEILAVRRGGPGSGRLEAGDVIVAIDGYLITTAAGGRRFARVQPGRPVRLRVRRDGREVDVTVTPSAECVRDAVPAAPRVAHAPRADVRVPREPVVAPVPRPAVPVPPVPRAAPEPDAVVAPEPALPPAFHLEPRARMGLSVSCDRCSFDVSEDLAAKWSFSAPPLLEAVERNGPAHRAGLRAGDRITHVDGLDITTDEAGRRFGSVRPSERLRIRYERNGAVRETVLVPDEVRPAPPDVPAPPRPVRERLTDVERARIVYERAVIAVRARETAERIRRVNEARAAYEHALQEARVQSDVVRFTGLLGDALISVTGAPVTVTESETEVVIRSAAITVRIRKTDGGERRR